MWCTYILKFGMHIKWGFVFSKLKNELLYFSVEKPYLSVARLLWDWECRACLMHQQYCLMHQYMPSCLICVHWIQDSYFVFLIDQILNSMYTNQAAWLILVHVSLLLYAAFFYNHISNPYSTCFKFTIFGPLSFRLFFMSMHMDKQGVYPRYTIQYIDWLFTHVSVGFMIN